MKKLFLLALLFFFLRLDLFAQTQIQLGSGVNATNTTTASPVNIYYQSGRGQMIYTLAELNAAGAVAGNIIKLGFYIEQVPIYDLPNFSIKMKHTAAVDAAVHDVGPFQEVYFDAAYAPKEGGFDLLTLDVPFLWNGTDNILIDVCFDLVQPIWNASGSVRYYSLNKGYRYGQSTVRDMCPEITTSTHSFKPQLLLEFAELTANDAGLIAINAPADFCAGAREVVVTIANFGNTLIDSLRVDWEFDGAPQPSVWYNTQLEPAGGGNNTAQLSLGVQNFAVGQEYPIRVWTADPNGEMDPASFNDTATTVVSPGMSGAYTIGGSDPDYQTFTSAVEDLELLGVCGPIVFNVRNGTYNEQLELLERPGMDADNTVTFQSESGDSAQVALTFSASSAKNYTLLLDGADWFVFKNLTLEAANASRSRVVALQNGATHNRFENCELRGLNVASTSDNHAIIYSSANEKRNEYNIFQNNYLRNGSYGVCWKGDSGGSVLETNNAFEHNRIEGAYYTGMFFEYQDALKLSDNDILINSASSARRGVHAKYCGQNSQFLRNKIKGVRNGIWLEICEGAANGKIEIINNFIQTTGLNEGFGIRSEYGSYQLIYHNSVQVRNTHASSAAFYTFVGGDKVLLNNIFANYEGGYAIRRSNTSGIGRSDYNNLYTTGSYLGDWDGNQESLAAWQSASSLDVHSLSLNPLFFSPDNFPLANTALKGAATPVPEASVDIEGDPRNALTPDVGADEFDLPALDLGLTAVLPPQTPFSSGQQTVAARLKNFGATEITSLTIEWKHNDTLQTAVNWTGQLSPGAELEIDLGSLDLTVNQAHEIHAWTVDPNGMTDPVNLNDTSSIKDLYAGLAGIYTLGGSSPDFNTFTEAAENLRQGGVVGSVLFNVRDGVYNEQVSLGEISGASEFNTVTFQSESGDSSSVRLSFNANSANNYILLLDGADWIRLKRMTLETENNTYCRVLELTNGASHNAFENCKFRGRSVTNSNMSYSVIYSVSNSLPNDYNVFNNNAVVNGSYGFYIKGSGSSLLEKGLVISGNQIDSAYSNGLYLSYMDAPLIKANRATTVTTHTSSKGFEFWYCYNDMEVLNNKVFGFRNMGIYLNGVYGTLANPVLVANNFVQVPGTGSAYGIYSNGGSFQKIYHNSVQISGTSSGNGFQNNGGRDKILLNNIFSNIGGGYAVYTNSTSAIIQSDHNNLYTTGSNLGYWSGGRADLAAWTAVSSLDSNSVSIAPSFISATDLHLANTDLDKLGRGLSEVSEDIDGEARNPIIPDIGADEIISAALDAGLYAVDAPSGLFPAGIQNVWARIINNGSTPLTSVDIEWEVNGLAQTTYNWTGALAAGQVSEAVNLGLFDFQAAIPHAIKAWTHEPNAGTDEEPANDTLTIANLYPALSGAYTVGGTGPDFFTFTEARNALVSYGVAGSVTFNVRDGIYNEQIALPEINGMSDTHTVTFQSESGDSSLVNLTYTASSAGNYTILLDGGDWFIFKNLSIEAADDVYGRAFVLQNEANYNRLENCELRGYDSNSASINHAVVYSPTSSLLDEYNVFQNCLIKQGAYGFYLSGRNSNSYDLESGNVIKDCRVENHYYRGIYARYQNAIQVTNNVVLTDKTYDDSRGVEFNDVYNHAQIARNRILGFRRGIFLTNSYGTPGAYIEVANNFVQTEGTDLRYSIHSNSGSYQNFFHNTVRQLNTHSSSAAFYVLNGASKKAYNNIFANEGGGYAIYADDALAQSDANNLYTTGFYLGFWGGALKTLSDWQNASYLDVASFALDPFFLTPDTYPVGQALFNGNANTLAGLAEDIEGEARDLQNPDIGCDEFTPAATDAGVAAILPPPTPFALGSQMVSAELKNFGLNDLTSATINWSVNDAPQTPVDWTGAVAAGAGETLTLGNFNFEVNQKYKIAAWTSQPNGETDLLMINDTATIDSVYAGLSGAFTLGGASPDFNTFAEAAINLQQGGLTGATTFNVRAGVYNEQLVLREVPGAGMSNTFTFQSESGNSSQVILTFGANSTANYTVLLDGADWLRFKNMTLQATNTTYGKVLDLRNGATQNRFENNAFQGINTLSADVRRAVIYSPDNGNLDSYNSFSGNAVLNGSYGFYLLGDNTGNLESALVVENNLIEGSYHRGLYLRYMDRPFIHSNRIITNSPNTSSQGIRLQDNFNELEISANRIIGFQNAGVYMENSDAEAANPMLIANNFIQTQGSLTGYGIRTDYGVYQQFYHNTVHVRNTNASSYAFYTSQGNNKDVRNNIFAHTGGGYAYVVYNTSVSISDYNDLYTNGVNMGYWEGDRATLADWQAAGGRDLHSISHNPLFIQADSFAVAQFFLDRMGTPLEEITTDIEGEARDPLYPDIGCDEFVPLADDAGVAQVLPPPPPFASGQQTIRVGLKNFGADTLRSVRLNWTLNGAPQAPVDWTGVIASGDTLAADLATVNFSINQAYDVTAWTSLPNGATDLVLLNDSSSVENVYAGLGGVYTIGGVSPDFNTFGEAATNLEIGGVLSAVTFNVRSGLYEEQLILNEIIGTDSLNTVLFQSETGDSTDVELAFLANSSANYTLRINGADYLRFHAMTLASSSNVYNRVMDVLEGSNYLNFTNCYFRSASTNYTNIYITGISEYLTFRRNFIELGYYGIAWDGNANGGNYLSGTIVEYNEFKNQSQGGLNLDNQSFPQVNYNKIYGGQYGVVLDLCYNAARVIGNQIYDVSNQIGIYLDQVHGAADNPVVVANNFVQLGGTNLDYGIYSYYGDHQKIVHNSVNVTNTNTGSAAFYSFYGSNKFVLNNIFANPGGGYAIRANTPGAIALSDHNDLYTAGANVGYWSGARADLAAWIAASAMDSSSVSIDPNFVSDIDLHVNNITLDGLGRGVSEVVIDIDGEARNPVNPDLGADEFITAQNDVAAVSIDSPRQAFAADIHPIYVSIFNNSPDTLTSAAINWEVNGVAQPVFNWSGILGSAETRDSICIGNFLFEVATAYFITAWTSLPNGMEDEDMTNDTMKVENLYAALGGIYTIGGVEPDFPDFQSSVDAMIKGGVIDQVTFNVRDGVYEEQLVMPEIMGVDSVNTLTYQSESGDSSQVVLTYESQLSNANYTLMLDGADDLTFQKMTIEARGASYAGAIILRNSADRNLFQNNKIVGITGASSSSLVIIESGTENNYNTFQNNYVLEGNYGFVFDGNLSNLSRATLIQNNQFVNQYYRAIWIEYHDAPIIAGNTIRADSPVSGYDALYMYNCQNNFKIIGNDITALDRDVGLEIRNTQGTPGNFGLIANNFVHLGTNGDYGIYLNDVDYVKVYHNNVHLVTTNSGDASLYVYNCDNLEVWNNIIVQSGPGYIFYKSGGSNVHSNYNDYYGAGTYSSHWDGTTVDGLAAWQTLTNQDANSLSINPLFASSSDLHVGEVDLNKAGAPLSEVTEDIDGEARDQLTPDIGADEFMLTTANDAGIVEITYPDKIRPFGEGVQLVEVVIRNNGSDTLTQANVNWLVNSIAQPPFQWTGFLEPGGRDTVSIGHFNFALKVPYDVLAFTSQPNGAVDSLTFNDSTMVADLHAGLEGVYTIGGLLPDFVSFSEAAYVLNFGGILGPVTFDVRNGVYNDQMSLGEIRGSSALNPLVFQSESGDSTLVRLTNSISSPDYTVQLNGTDYVSFQNMTLQAGHSSYSTVVELGNGATNVNFLHNRIIAPAFSGDNLIESVGYSLDYNLVFRNNVFEGGGYAIELEGAHTGSLESGAVVEGNTFTLQRDGAVFMIYMDAPSIRSNFISGAGSGTTFYGLYLRYCDNGLEVSKNKIIHSSDYGVYFDRCDGSSENRGLTVNNFFHLEGDAVSYGVRYYNCNFQNFYFNNVHVVGTNASSRAFYLSGGGNNNLLNNVLANVGGGYAVYATSGLGGSNYNNLYASGPWLGNWAGANATDLSAWQSLTGKGAQSVSTNPLFYSDTDLHVLQVALDSAATSITGITEDIDGDIRRADYPDIGADEFNYLADDLGVVALLSPTDNCDLSGAEEVKIVVQNFGGLPQTGFDVAYRLADGAAIVENVGGLSVPPGDTAHYIFSTKANIAAYQTYSFEISTQLAGDLNPPNDIFNAVVTNHLKPASVNNMLPLDGAVNIERPLNFSWAPSSGALRYDFYFWLAGDPFPTEPFAQDLAEISYFYNSSSLIYGATYNWQVVAKNDFCETPGPVQSFTIRELPDLVVQNVQTPNMASSEQSVSISWEVHNTTMNGATGMTRWYDYVYLSLDEIYQPGVDTYLGGFINLTALGPNEFYSQTKEVVLPQGIQGTYYIFIVSDRNNNIFEVDNDNNTSAGAVLPVMLTPPPDLEIPSILVSPTNTFSGLDVNVTWVVENVGPGDMKPDNDTYWDRIYLSDQETFNLADATFLASRKHNRSLAANEKDTLTQSITLPDGIQGDYYIHISADVFNQVFEHLSEDDNSATSDTISVTINPPPNLIVTNVSAPDTVDNWEKITLEWTVLNAGANPTENGFYDAVYISSYDVYHPDSVKYLGLFYNNALLERDSFIERSGTVNIPGDISGFHYFYVFTDYYNQVFEHDQEDDNITRSNNAEVLNADLSVSLNPVEATAYAGAEMLLEWTVENLGSGDVSPISRTDRIYISPDPVYNPASADLVGSLTYNNALPVGWHLARQKLIFLPNDISGTYYLHVFTDASDKIFEPAAEDNNIANSNSFEVLNADLVVSDIVLADSTFSGTDIAVAWTVKNQGPGDLGTLYRTDKIYLSDNPSFDPATATLAASLAYSNPLAAGDSLVWQKSVALPRGISGRRYIHIQTDANDSVYEPLNENNNERTDSTWVQLSPWPDLQISALTGLPETTTAGTLLTLNHTVENRGAAAVQSSGWTDRIYISANPVWTPSEAVLLKNLNILQAVGAGESYTISTDFNIPMLGNNATAGVCYIYVYADAADYIYEYTDENNNVLRSNPIFVFAPDPVDFHILNATTLPDTVWAGQSVNLQWMVQNQGSSTGLWNYPLWYDGVFLCVDSVWQANYEYFIKDFTQQGPIDYLETYAKNQTFNISEDFSGDYYVFIVADHNGRTNNTLDDNSIRRIRPASDPNSSHAKPIHIKQRPLLNLEAESFAAPSVGLAGQPIEATWRVSNTGEGTTSGTWTDKIYLSNDLQIDQGDWIIGTKTQSRALGANDFYEDTLSFYLPRGSSGNYVLIFKTDANNTVFELDGEDDNTFFTYLTVEQPMPSDLVISEIAANSTAMVGEPYTINYTTKNEGVNPATGVMSELLYFSADSIFDASDLQFTPPISRSINLAPQAGSANSVTSDLPGLALGDYFIVAHTDILDNIVEGNELNNVRISTQKVSVAVQELLMDVPTADTLHYHKNLYYRIEIPDSLESETLLLSLDALPEDGVNELYLSFNQVPTRSNHDYSFGEPFAPDQEIIVPELEKGTYYLLAYGSTTESEEDQAIVLHAQIINFSIRDIDANQGGNTGNTTVKLEGAKFTPNMTVRLEDVDLGTIWASKLTFVNSTSAFVTFPLSGVAEGLYDVIAEKPGGETALLADGFVVIAGDAGTSVSGGGSGAGGFYCQITNIGAEQNMQKNLAHPTAVRLNRLVPITIQFGNNGNVDIPCPARFIISLRGAPLSFIPNEFSENKQALYLFFEEPGGPPGILRPGSSSSITVYSFSSHPLRFSLRE